MNGTPEAFLSVSASLYRLRLLKGGFLINGRPFDGSRIDLRVQHEDAGMMSVFEIV